MALNDLTAVFCWITASEHIRWSGLLRGLEFGDRKIKHRMSSTNGSRT